MTTVEKNPSLFRLNTTNARRDRRRNLGRASLSLNTNSAVFLVTNREPANGKSKSEVGRQRRKWSQVRVISGQTKLVSASWLEFVHLVAFVLLQFWFCLGNGNAKQMASVSDLKMLHQYQFGHHHHAHTHSQLAQVSQHPGETLEPLFSPHRNNIDHSN